VNQEIPISGALLLSAGLGTRLGPLGAIRPKALFPVLDKPMLRRWLERLVAFGVGRVAVNAFHLAGQVEAAVESLRGSFPSLSLTVLREPEILGTGGGVRNAAPLFGGPFLVLNSDIHSDLPLGGLLEAHLSDPGRLATLAVADWPGGTVSVGEGGGVLAFRPEGAVPGEASRLFGLGMMLVSFEAAMALPREPSDLIEGLAGQMASGGRVGTLLSDGRGWADIGTVAAYHSLNLRLARGRSFVHPGARVEGDVAGFLVAEEGAQVEPGAYVENCVLWSGARVCEGAELKSMVVAGRAAPGLRMSGGVIRGA
jgi:mannose-1-phosphate guanylyltransferase